MAERSSSRRIPKALSHSAVSLYYKDAEEFYLRYLCPHRTPRVPQANFMAIGAAFDAYEKSLLHEILFGKGANPQFEFDAIFESQVEPHNRDWAREHGRFVMDSYHRSGAHDDLLKLLAKSDGSALFEAGLHEFLERFLAGVSALHGALQSEYFEAHLGDAACAS